MRFTYYLTNVPVKEFWIAQTGFQTIQIHEVQELWKHHEEVVDFVAKDGVQLKLH